MFNPKFCDKCHSLVSAGSTCSKCFPKNNKGDKNNKDDKKQYGNVEPVNNLLEALSATFAAGSEKRLYNLLLVDSEKFINSHGQDAADYVKCTCLPADDDDVKVTVFIELSYFIDHPTSIELMLKKGVVRCKRKCGRVCAFNVEDTGDLCMKTDAYIRTARAGKITEEESYTESSDF